MATSFAPYPFTPFDRHSDRAVVGPAAPGGCHPFLVDLAAADGEAGAEPEAPDEVLPSDAEAREDGAPMAPDGFSRADLEAAVSEAEHRTRSAVEEAAEIRIERSLAEAMERLADQLVAIREAEVAVRSTRAAADAGLAVAVARSIVPCALARAPLADLEAMLVELFQGLEREPRLELRLAPDLVEAGRRLVQEVAERIGWRGAIEVDADDTLAVGDARMIWAEGRAERRLERLIADVEQMLSSVFAERPPDDPEVGPQAAANGAAGGEA